MIQTSAIGMPDCLDSSTSIPLAKNLVQSSGTCATFLKGICADNHWLGLRWEHLLHFLIRCIPVMDVSARTTVKGAAKCEIRHKVQEPVQPS